MTADLDRLCMGCMEEKGNEETCPFCGYDPSVPVIPSYLPPRTMLHSRYLVGKLLRYNGESAEYIGFDTQAGVKVTIKEYMPDTLCSRTKDSPVLSVRSNSVAQYKAFMSEFVELNKTLAKMRTLSHINPPTDMFGDNNTGYVIFKYIEGINLSKYLKENAGELSWDTVREMFPPIFTTLSLIHNAGVIHRGIAPENIIVGKDNDLKLIGFCISDARTANTELSSEIYSGYAAPEQYSSSNWQGTWTDVYGLSALLYRMLTGTTPTNAMERTANDTLPEPRSLNGNIPPNISKVIMGGLELSRDMRIQTITEFVTQLFEEPEWNRRQPDEDGDEEEEPVRRSSQKAKKKQPSRHKVFWIALVSAAVLMMGLMTFLITSLDDHSDSMLVNMTTTTGVLSDISDMTTDDMTQSDISESDTGLTLDEADGSASLPTLAVTGSEGESDAAQTSVKSGSTVYVMNDLVGKSYDTVKNSAIIENLTIVCDYVYTNDYEKGTIFAQSIAKGENYAKGDECVLSISMGSGQIEIPDFTGLNKRDYFELLGSLGIKYEEKYSETESVLNDYVAWISKDPGEIIDLEAGEVLEVYVAVNDLHETTTVTTTVVTIPTETTTTAFVTTVPPAPVTVTTQEAPPPYVPWEDTEPGETQITMRGDY